MKKYALKVQNYQETFVKDSKEKTYPHQQVQSMITYIEKKRSNALKKEFAFALEKFYNAV